VDSSIRKNLIIGIIVGLVVGLLLGMALFWGLFPVKWTDAHSYDLAPEAQAEYVGLVADSFSLDKDPASAARNLEQWTPEEKQEAVADSIQMYEETGQMVRLQRVQDMAMVLAIPLPTEVPSIVETVEPPVTGVWNRLRVPCLVFLFVLLALVLALLGLRMLVKRRSPADKPTLGEPPEEAAGMSRASSMSRTESQRRGAPTLLGRYQTTYQVGEDTYDESFSIEGPTGEFLGECGLGIAETIGEGQPDKVTAFEVWLFDKSDIRTVTKVLMSEYSFQDDAVRSRLAAKGEAVLAQPGSLITLETNGLQMQVEVTDLVLGGDEGGLPPNSYFAKLAVEMVTAGKPTGPRGGDSG